MLLKNGTVVDYLNDLCCDRDLGIKDGVIVEIGPDLNSSYAKEVFDISGCYLMPGIIDLHVHTSAWLGGEFGHRMLAQAGVTTALDMSGPIDSVLDVAKKYGAGLNIGTIEYVRPGETVKSQDPTDTELQNLLEDCMMKGSLGLKLLGGHYPLTPSATARAIEIANKNRSYIAFHAGTLEKGSNIEGFLEAVTLAQGNALHLAHINSYCRGSVRSSIEETEEAIEALINNPKIRSESYLSPLNGTSAKCSNGEPESLVTRRCLITGGFAPTEVGMKEAIFAGWAQINMEEGGKIILATGEKAFNYWCEKGGDTTVSFSVNPPEPRIRLATAKRNNGEFVVDAISTDGGGIPRNVIVPMGLALVNLQALSIKELVRKVSYNPACILGLRNKGHLSLGADADITVLDIKHQQPFLSIVNGKMVMYKGYICGQGSQIVTTDVGQRHVRKQGLAPIVVDLANSKFYQ